MEQIKESIKNRYKNKNPVTNYIKNRLSYNNVQTYAVKKAIRIFFELIFIEILYLLYCYRFFQGVWYLNFFLIISGLIFGYSYLDIRLELLDRKFKQDIPKTIRRLRYYLLHKRNISKALKATYVSAPDSTKKCMNQLYNAVSSNNVKSELDKVKKNMPLEYLKIFCNLILYCSENGDRDNATSKNLNRLTNIMEFKNIQQGLDNVELLGCQVFVFIIPLIGIPGIRMINETLLSAVEQVEYYSMSSSNIQAATILIFSNIFTLFLSWIRKNS